MTSTTLEQEVAKLTPAERLELIGKIWDSLQVPAPNLPIPDWHREELEERLAEADASPTSSIPWETVRDRLRAFASRLS